MKSVKYLQHLPSKSKLGSISVERLKKSGRIDSTLRIIQLSTFVENCFVNGLVSSSVCCLLLVWATFDWKKKISWLECTVIQQHTLLYYCCSVYILMIQSILRARVDPPTLHHLPLNTHNPESLSLLSALPYLLWEAQPFNIRQCSQITLCFG